MVRYIAIACVSAFAIAIGISGIAQAEEKPDVVLQGTLTGKHHQTYLELPFNVPAGTARISVAFEYTGRDRKTTVDLGLIGPDGFMGHDGFRGWSGGNKQQFTVSATDATPSYQAGPLKPGRWILLLGLPNIRVSSKDQYRAQIWLSEAQTPPWLPRALNPPLLAEAKWYRGDLHAHDAHSDASCRSMKGNSVPCPVFLTAQKAAESGLDFVSITDHNTQTQANIIRELQPYFDRLLLLPGREITTFSGHANLFGVVAPLDFRVGSRDVASWNVLLARARELQGVVSINHPVRPSDERCMGCGWTPKAAVHDGLIQAVEVVNGLDADTPYSGIPFWHAMLNAGQKITAIGGSDNHNATLEKSEIGSSRLGQPTTVIYAASLSTPDLLQGIREGRVVVDVQGSRDRLLTWQAQHQSQIVEMGANLAVKRGEDVEFTAQLHHVAGASVELIVDDHVVRDIDGRRIVGDRAQWTYRWRSDGGRHWLRINVRDPQGKLLLVGNPIYVNFR